jgi:outer membrane protein
MNLGKAQAPLLLLAALAVPVPATSESLSRAEAVARALAANPQVRKSLETQAAFLGKKQEVMADALPEVKLLGAAMRYRDPSFLNSGSFDKLPPEFVDALTVVPTNLYDGQLVLKQTVWNFSVGAAIRGAKVAVKMSDEDIRRVRQQVALDAVQAYNGYLAALAVIRVGENAVAQKEKQLENARNRRTAGVATELEVLRFEVDLQSARTEFLRVQGQADLARGRLNAVMMLPVDAEVAPSDTLAYVPLDLTLDDTIREAWRERPEAKTAGLNERLQDEVIKVANADRLPRLDLAGAYGWAVRDLDNFFKSNYAKWSVGLTLTVPIFDGQRTAGRVAQARAERNKATQDTLALENQIQLEAKEALDRLRVAKSVLEGAELNVKQAGRALEMTQANYRAGAATTLDVLDAQSAFTQADYRRVEALYQHANARALARYVMARDPLDPPQGSEAVPPSQESRLSPTGETR